MRAGGRKGGARRRDAEPLFFLRGSIRRLIPPPHPLPPKNELRTRLQRNGYRGVPATAAAVLLTASVVLRPPHPSPSPSSHPLPPSLLPRAATGTTAAARSYPSPSAKRRTSSSTAPTTAATPSSPTSNDGRAASHVCKWSNGECASAAEHVTAQAILRRESELCQSAFGEAQVYQGGPQLDGKYLLRIVYDADPESASFDTRTGSISTTPYVATTQNAAGDRVLTVVATEQDATPLEIRYRQVSSASASGGSVTYLDITPEGVTDSQYLTVSAPSAHLHISHPCRQFPNVHWRVGQRSRDVRAASQPDLVVSWHAVVAVDGGEFRLRDARRNDGLHHVSGQPEPSRPSVPNEEAGAMIHGTTVGKGWGTVQRAPTCLRQATDATRLSRVGRTPPLPVLRQLHLRAVP